MKFFVQWSGSEYCSSMTDTLSAAARRYADVHADADGIAATPITGFTIIRATRRSELQYAISQPLVALVVQGSKRVMMGSQIFDLGAGDSLLINADIPTVSQITGASVGAPYLSLVFDLNLPMIEELVAEMDMTRSDNDTSIRVETTDTEVADAALRLMRLLDRPAAVPVLEAQTMREMHYWLLAGRHGLAIRQLGVAKGSIRCVGRAVAIIRTEYTQPLRIERLAEAAGMSPSSFHHHFRAVTSLSPLQFQKQLRLIEAKRMMISQASSASVAAYAVGYESVPQFTREYARMFGAPPVRDIKLLKSRMTSPASGS